MKLIVLKNGYDPLLCSVVFVHCVKSDCWDKIPSQMFLAHVGIVLSPISTTSEISPASV